MRKTRSVEATRQLGEVLAHYLQPGDVIVLDGSLGAGKTQFVQGVAKGLGIEEPVTSPTFNILQVYHGGRIPLYHFDLYRLNDSEELEDIGYFETLEGDGVSLIEWGKRFPNAMPYSYLEIDFSVDDENLRKILIHSYGGRPRELLYVWANDSRSRLVKVSSRGAEDRR